MRVGPKVKVRNLRRGHVKRLVGLKGLPKTSRALCRTENQASSPICPFGVDVLLFVRNCLGKPQMAEMRCGSLFVRGSAAEAEFVVEFVLEQIPLMRARDRFLPVHMIDCIVPSDYFPDPHILAHPITGIKTPPN
jgi:hypothetical protein